MKFTFDEKIISFKILKSKYPNLTDETIDEFLNADLDIDCINYTPLASFRVNENPDLDKNNIIKILKSGVNVVTTVGFLFPKAFGEDYLNEIEEACKEGGVSLHGTGYNPGWLAELVPLTMTGMSQEIKKIIVIPNSKFMKC